MGDENKQINDALLQYITWDKNPVTRHEMQSLMGNNDELKKRLFNRLEFGTAGLRARMGAGYNQMNDLTLIQTGQGLYTYLANQYKDLNERGIIISYDGRHNSKKWAQLTANIFLHNNVKVYLYSDLTPTPFVPYGVNRYKCVCGVMITASHNPKEDNGYKVYGCNGAQIISPADKLISNCITAKLEPWSYSWDFEDLSNYQKLLRDPLSEVMKAYYNAQLLELRYTESKNSKCNFSVVYSPMHGVGWRYAKEMTDRMGFPSNFLCVVPEQRKPDPEFPTVAFPNPEEGKSSLDLSIKLANRMKINVIFANDPDADRLAIAEKNNDEWSVLTGNEIGTLLGWWLFTHSAVQPVEDIYMLSSAVSSKILHSFSKKWFFNHRETLTGFKWMGNVACDLAKQGKKVVFAFEEAIGFMCGSVVLDKDGISALGVSAEMVNSLYSQGKTLRQKLQAIYKEFGYHISNNGYYFCYNPKMLYEMFNKLRNPYPTKCGSYAITRVIDVTQGYDSADSQKKCKLFPVTKSSQMIMFFFANSAVVTLRGSGTEPKIKWYSEIVGADAEKLQADLKDLIHHVVEEFYQPEKRGFSAKQD